MSYVNAKQTQLLATHCCVCGLPLCDAKSVELGIGPVCRKKYVQTDHISEEARVEANRLIYDASALYGESAGKDDIEDVLKIADRLLYLGLPLISEKIAFRFVPIRLEVEEDVTVWRWNRAEKREEATDDTHTVVNVFCPSDANQGIKRLPYKRPVKDERGFHWQVRRADSRRLLGVLADAFGGRWALGPKGSFRIPTTDEYKAKFASPRPVKLAPGEEPPGTVPGDNPVRGDQPIRLFDLRAFKRRRAASVRKGAA